jgi:3-methyladenine DNA glycosylase Tag
LLAQYHDEEWGIPTRDEQLLYELLLLEAIQAGLSWQVILSKRENFRRAFDGFDAHQIAAYGQDKIDALEAQKEALEAELSQLKGIFSGKRRKEIETRLAEIETELKGL